MTRALIAVLIGLCGLSLSAFWGELRAWAGARMPAQVQVGRLVSTEPDLPLSLAGRAHVLGPCLDMATRPDMRLAPAAERRALAGACTALADRLGPGSGLAAEIALVRAAAARVMQRHDALPALIETARAEAPRSGWLALRRVDLLAATPAARTAPALRGFEADLAVLLSSARSRDLVVARYAGWDASARAALRRTADAASETDG